MIETQNLKNQKIVRPGVRLGWTGMDQIRPASCRKFLLDTVRQSETLFAFAAALLDASDSECPFVYVNDRMTRLLGYRGDELEGRSIQALFGAKTDSETRLRARLGMQRGEYTEIDVLCYRRSGASFWNRITLTPIRDDENRVCLYLLSGQDITRIRRLEDALLQPVHLTDRTARSMQVVIDKTEARFQAVRQFQSVLVAHLERSWRRFISRSRAAENDPAGDDALLMPPPPGRNSALMGGVIANGTAQSRGRLSA